MVFINTGSRAENPYSSPRTNSDGGRCGRVASATSSSWKIWRRSSRRRVVPPRIWLLFAVLVLIWFVAIVSVVTENPEMKREVLRDLRREESLIRSELRRGKSRAREWARKEKRWLRDHLDDPDDAEALSSAASLSREAQEGDEEGEGRNHPWDLTQLEDLALRVGPGDTPIHLAFVTDCGAGDRRRSHQIFLSALRVRQPGRITHIASGCADDEADGLRMWHQVFVAPLSFRFGLHLAPAYDAHLRRAYGTRHWMELGEGMGIDSNSGEPLRHDTIVVLIDVEQVLLRPITGRFSSEDGDVFRTGGGGPNGGENVDSPLSLAQGRPAFAVGHGRPLSQEYGIRDGWRDHASAAAGPDSLAAKVTVTEALRNYAMGPPHLATASDAYSTVVRWCELAPAVHAEYPHQLAESYAFSMAAADVGLPRQLMASLMVSDAAGDGNGEGGGGLDAMPGDEVCPFASNEPDHDVHALPSTLYLSHRYGVGDTAFFADEKVPADFFSCGSPLLEEPAMDIGSGKYLYRKPPFVDARKEFSAAVEKRMAFLICAATGFLNEAAIYFKGRHCGDDANMKKEINLHDLPEIAAN